MAVEMEHLFVALEARGDIIVSENIESNARLKSLYTSSLPLINPNATSIPQNRQHPKVTIFCSHAN